jgi:hypothetical protein
VGEAGIQVSVHSLYVKRVDFPLLIVQRLLRKPTINPLFKAMLPPPVLLPLVFERTAYVVPMATYS